MTYNVFGGTLNLYLSIYSMQTHIMHIASYITAYTALTVKPKQS